MYTLHQFTQKLITLTQSKDKANPILPLFTDLEELSYQLQNMELIKRRGDYFTLKCDNCKKTFNVYASYLEWEWESSGNWDRGTEWLDTEHIECDECGDDIEISIALWEHPQGQLYSKDISCFGAEIVRDMDISKFLPFGNGFYDDGFNVCENCGMLSDDIDEFGLCPDCRKMIKDKMDKE